MHASQHASPAELRERARQHLRNWRLLAKHEPAAAKEELYKASNLAMLAAEAEESGR